MTSVIPDYTVYTKPGCPNCVKTMEYFDRKGITYQAIDITKVPAALAYIAEDLGYSEAPVVQSNSEENDHWSGIRMDKLTQAALRRKAA